MRAMLGMLLFIASEIMLFGSFFTAYFFIRVVERRRRGRRRRSTCPVFVAGVNTAILVTSSFTDALGAAGDQAREPRRAAGRARADGCCIGLTFLLTQIREYARVGFAPHDGAFGTIFYCLTGLHGAHVFVGLRCS